MKFALACLILLAILLPKFVFSQLALDVVYPREGEVVTASDSTFVFGSVSNPAARVTVNDFPVAVYPNGAFLGMVPVTQGDFQLKCEAVVDSQRVAVVREVPIQPFLATTPRDTFAIDSSYVFPQDDLELLPGDYIHVAFKGTPGLIGTCTIPGLVQAGPMAEAEPAQEFYWGEAVFGDGKASTSPEVDGVYTGVFKIDADAQLDSAEIIFNLTAGDGLNLETRAPGRLTVRDERVPKIAELTVGLTVARTGPGLAYQQFLPEGVRLQITGRNGHYSRARLTRAENLWVPTANLNFLSAGTPIPSSKVSLVRTESFTTKVRVKIYLQQRLPFRIEQTETPSALVVTIYGVTSDTDWIRYDFSDPTIRNLRWTQPWDGVYRLTIELSHAQQWGYHPYYEGNNLVVEIRKPPQRLKLNQLLICIDPGHAPDDGAVGPTRLKEKDANLELALVLKEKLEKKGAKVFLTRKEQHGASLAVRTQMAVFLESDILLSLHHNALPDGVNPFTNRGTSTYYYHVQSRPLAVAIQRRLLEKLRLNNFGLYYDNLALCRPPQMPAVLIEPAFIMHPEEEMLINSGKYKRKTAEAIIKGIEDFLKQAKDEG